MESLLAKTCTLGSQDLSPAELPLCSQRTSAASLECNKQQVSLFCSTSSGFTTDTHTCPQAGLPQGSYFELGTEVGQELEVLPYPSLSGCSSYGGRSRPSRQGRNYPDRGPYPLNRKSTGKLNWILVEIENLLWSRLQLWRCATSGKRLHLPELPSSFLLSGNANDTVLHLDYSIGLN